MVDISVVNGFGGAYRVTDRMFPGDQSGYR